MKQNVPCSVMCTSCMGIGHSKLSIIDESEVDDEE